MNFRVPLRRISSFVGRTYTCTRVSHVHKEVLTVRPTFRTRTNAKVANCEPSGLFRTFSVSATSAHEDEDKVTTEEMMQMLEHDTELQTMLKDIVKDFDPNPPPPEPPKLRQQGDVEMDSQHEPHYQEQENSPDNVPMSLLQRYKHYRDEDSQVILDVDEERQEEEQDFYLYQEKKNRFSGLDFKRGKEGVFDMPELVKILQDENLQDLAVISIPEELHYASYLVLATAKSPRHSLAVMEYIRKLNKLKKNSRDPFLKIDGEKCHEWKVLDMGNIVLHVFLPSTREMYDLETLWTVGEKYDDLYNKPEDPFYDTLEEQMKFLEATKQRETQQC